MFLFNWINQWWTTLRDWQIPAASQPVNVVLVSNPPYGGSGGYGTFSFQGLTSTANGNITVPVRRSVGFSGAVGVEVLAVDGTAVRNTDYFVSAVTTLSWANLESAEKLISVSIVPSITSKTFKLRLQNPTGGAVLDGTYYEITITIPATTGAGGLIRFFTGTYLSGDATGWYKESTTYNLPVSRLVSVSGAVGCSYHTEDGTAVAGVNYTTSSGTVSFGAGVTYALTGNIPILTVGSDGLYFWIVLDTPTGGARIPTTEGNRLKVTIKKTVVTPGSLQFFDSQIQVPESTVNSYTVQRIGGSSGAISVNYSCANATAANGVDYTAASGTLNWADGDTANKTFNVTTLAVSVDNLYFNVNLSAPGGGASLGTIPTCQTYILNTGSIPSAPLTDVLEGYAYGTTADVIADQVTCTPNSNVHIVQGNRLVGGYIFFGGATDTFGRGTDLRTDDDTLVQSMPSRFQMFEM